MGDKSGSNKMTQKIGEKVNEISAKAYNIIPDRIKKSTAFSFIEKEMGSDIFKNIFLFVIIIGVIYGVYKIYTSIRNEQVNRPYFHAAGNSTDLGPYKASDPASSVIIPNSILPSTLGEYSISMWLWINDLGKGESRSQADYYRHILHKGDSLSSTSQPGMWLHPTKNEILVVYDNDTSHYEYDYKEGQQFAFDTDNNLPQPDNPAPALQKVKDNCSSNDSCKGFNVTTQYPYNNDADVYFAGLSELGSPSEDVNNNPRCGGGVCSGAFVKKDWSKEKKKNGEAGQMDPNVNSSIITNRDISTIITDLPINTWFNVTLTAFNNVMEIYVDGKLRDTIVTSSRLKNNNGDIYITKDFSSDPSMSGISGPSFNGYWTHGRYYNSALNQVEVRDVYNKGPSPYVLPDITGNFQKIQTHTAKLLGIQRGVKIGRKRYTTTDVMNVIRGQKP